MKNWILLSFMLLLGTLIGVVLRYPAEMTPGDSHLAPMQPPISERGTVSPAWDAGSASQSNDPEIYEILVADLEDLRIANQQQEQRISLLQGRVQSLEENLAKNLVAYTSGQPKVALTTVPDGKSEPSAEESLIAAGIDSQMASWIQQRLDENEMEKLYLKNSALREGWKNSSRYRKSMRELNARFNALREDIGDDNFDRLLYAVGRHNRVIVHSTMNNSPAQQFGLDSGDSILSYDGRRIFSKKELQDMASKGDTDSMISIEVMRDGGLMSLYIPGGPLGIRMKSRHVKP